MVLLRTSGGYMMERSLFMAHAIEVLTALLVKLADTLPQAALDAIQDAITRLQGLLG